VQTEEQQIISALRKWTLGSSVLGSKDLASSKHGAKLARKRRIEQPNSFKP
jgi:hypothetical protein